MHLVPEHKRPECIVTARHFIYFHLSNVHNMQSRYFYPHSAEEETNLEGSYDVPRATQPVRIQNRIVDLQV